MRRSQRKPSVRKKATRRQARGGGYGAGPQSGGMVLPAMAPLAEFFTSVPGIVVMVAALASGLFIAANKEMLPGQKRNALDYFPESVADRFSSPDDQGQRPKISVDPRKYWTRYRKGQLHYQREGTREIDRIRESNLRAEARAEMAEIAAAGPRPRLPGSRHPTAAP